MPKDRLNLLIERALIERGRRYTESHKTSLSRLVGDYLSSLPVENDVGEAELTPTVKRLLGIGQGVGIEDYRRHIEEKYGR